MNLSRVSGIFLIGQQILHFLALISNLVDFIKKQLFTLEDLIVDTIFKQS